MPDGASWRLPRPGGSGRRQRPSKRCGISPTCSLLLTTAQASCACRRRRGDMEAARQRTTGRRKIHHLDQLATFLSYRTQLSVGLLDEESPVETGRSLPRKLHVGQPRNLVLDGLGIFRVTAVHVNAGVLLDVVVEAGLVDLVADALLLSGEVEIIRQLAQLQELRFHTAAECARRGERARHDILANLRSRTRKEQEACHAGRGAHTHPVLVSLRQVLDGALIDAGGLFGSRAEQFSQANGLDPLVGSGNAQVDGLHRPAGQGLHNPVLLELVVRRGAEEASQAHHDVVVMCQRLRLELREPVRAVQQPRAPEPNAA
eukprot:scaffold1004_cov269-Pinguiococcus_pyrenoidosus.AAC.16